MRFFFFDIDGTLAYPKNGRACIPASAKAAIAGLKANGHIVAIASGRQIATLLPVMAECGIDHAVSDGGYGLIINQKVLYVRPLAKALINKLCFELEEKKIAYAVMEKDHPRTLFAAKKMMADSTGFGENMRLVILDDYDPRRHDITKVFITCPIGHEDDIQTVNMRKITRYHPGYLVYEPDDKYDGVKALVNYFHGDLKDVVCFGDGFNDVDLFKKAACGIAMGNSIPELKAVATYITTDADNDGIYKACKHFGWI